MTEDHQVDRAMVIFSRIAASSNKYLKRTRQCRAAYVGVRQESSRALRSGKATVRVSVIGEVRCSHAYPVNTHTHYM